MNTSRTSPASRRGAVLIVALLLATGLAIAIGSYLSITKTNLKISGRAFHNNTAMNLAETGLEEALWSINRNLEGNAAAWTGWTRDGSEATRTFGPVDLGQNTVGSTRVHVSNTSTSGSAPVIAVRATVSPNNQAPIEKWVSVSLRKRSKFANGLVAKESIVFRGTNASVDSWNSVSGGTIVPYSAGVRLDGGTVGSISVSVDAVLVKNADIWGYVATGFDDVTNTVGAGGSILGADSAAKDKTTWDVATVDPDRVSTDFTSSMDPVTAPATTYALGSVSNDLTLPRSGDTPAADGKYYYSTTSVSLTNKTLTVTGSKNVVLVATGNVSTGGGSGSIQINNGSRLELYAAADVTLSGNGVANGTSSATTAVAQQPINFQIWGTNPTAQNIDIKGNGVLSAIVYAPSAAVFINGNGDVLGSVVAKNVTMVGNAAFHYDESLADFGGSSPYGISRWTELTSAAQRNDFREDLVF
jgi:Tfp pilus assembly protein PilX